MDTVVRAATLYLVLLLLFRLMGRRTIGEMSNFDFVLVLIVGEASQQALLGEDFSITGGVLAICTLLLLERFLSSVKHRWSVVDRLVDGEPIFLIRDGELQRETMRREKLREDDLLEAARVHRGLDRIDDVRHAILERDGQISIVPRRHPD